jgi:acetoin utilization protein AcuB
MLRLSDVMSTEVATIAPNASTDEARARMRSRGIRHLIVVEAGAAVGALSLSDLGGRKGIRGNGNLAVRERMTPAPFTAAPDTTVRQAARLLRARAIGCLPVCRDGKVVGIVTVSDLLDVLGRGVEIRPPHRERQTLTERKARTKVEWGYPKR